MTASGRQNSPSPGPFPALTAREAAVLEAIGELRMEGVTPSCARLGRCIGRTSGAVFAPVLSLVEKGFLTRGAFGAVDPADRARRGVFAARLFGLGLGRKGRVMSPSVCESLVSSPRFAASARTAKNVPDHRGARAGASRGFIVESGKADTYSRNLARIRFTPASVNLRPCRAFPPTNLTGWLSGWPVFFGVFFGLGVGAPWASASATAVSVWMVCAVGMVSSFRLWLQLSRRAFPWSDSTTGGGAACAKISCVRSKNHAARKGAP